MTSAMDERGAEASRKFRVPLTASLVSSLIVRLEHRSGLDAFDWALARSVRRCRPTADQRLRAHPHQRA